MRAPLLLLGCAAVVAGCVESSRNTAPTPTPTPALRSLAVRVIDAAGAPLQGTLISSKDATVFDTRDTDADGLALLQVVDGGFVTAHVNLGHWFSSETVAVLASDSAFTIKLIDFDHRWESAPTSLLNVTVTGGGGQFGSVVGLYSTVDGVCAEGATFPLTLDLTFRGYPPEDLFSVFSICQQQPATTYFGVTRDVALGATSAQVAMTVDSGSTLAASVSNATDPSIVDATPYWRGEPVGFGDVKNVLAGPMRLFGVPFADSIHTRLLRTIGPWTDYRLLNTFASIPPTTTTWTVDAALHLPTFVDSAFVDTSGSPTLTWTTLDDGIPAQNVFARLTWKDGADRHEWLFDLPPSPGATAVLLPPAPPGFDQAIGSAILDVAFEQRDWVQSYADTRNLPPAPLFYRELQSVRGPSNPVFYP